MRILLVEDHQGSRTAFCALLRNRGHDVTLAAAVRDALEVVRKGPGFDLLICDLTLPDGDGWELMETLHAQGALPGIAISGLGSPGDHERSAAAGFAYHLVKPVDLQELDIAIENAVRSRFAND